MTGDFSFVKHVQPWLGRPRVKCIFCNVLSICLELLVVSSEKSGLSVFCCHLCC